MDITIIIAKIKEIMEEWFPLKEDVPTKTSDLINDANFLTQQDIKTYGTFTELQTIINNASDGDTIILDKDYKNDGSSIVDGFGIEIDKDLTIIGNGHIIDGNHLSCIFYTNYTTLTFENITLMNGNGLIDGANGGVIYGYALNFINCNFINNIGAYSGGAISGNGEIHIVGCNFINNSVDDGDGGAIYYASNNMTVTNSTFINNNANGDGGAIHLDVYNNSLFNISDCVFIDNAATGNGGGIYAYIGSTSGENLKVYNCTFENSVLYNVTNVNITEKEDKSNKITSISALSTDIQYPSAKSVYNNIKNKLEVTTETTLGSGGGTVWIATSSDKTNKNGWKIKDGAQNTFTNITYTNANINIGNAEVSITYQNKIKRPIRISYTITYNDNQQSNTKTATVNPGDEIYDIFISTPEPEPDHSGDGNSIDDSQEWMRYVYNVKSVQYTIYGQSNNINAIVNICYPVGSVYTSTDNTNPIFIFGGQWESITSETNNYRWKRTI